LTKKDAELILEVLNYEGLPPTARLLWVELRLSELYDLPTEKLMNSTWMRRENTRRLRAAHMISKKFNEGRRILVKGTERALDIVANSNKSALKIVANSNKSARKEGGVEGEKLTATNEGEKLVLDVELSREKIEERSKTRKKPIFSGFHSSTYSTILETKISKSKTAGEKNKVCRKQPKDRKRHSLRWMTMSTLLCDTLKKTSELRYDRHLGKWARQFKELHEVDGVPTSEMWKVLKWYCEQRVAGSGVKLPDCFSANMFRGAYLWIRREWKKNSAVIEAVDSRWIEAAEQSFGEFDFSKCPITIEQLAELYQLVHEWECDFRERLDSADESSMKKLLFMTMDVRGEGESLPKQLGRFIYERVGKWVDWSGNLDTFKPRGRDFIEFLQRRYLPVMQSRLPQSYLAFLMGTKNATD